ncbi:Reverse transcriptase (RNA-dependent DNA polymerase) [Fragilaria crotonensis]|nr:Reverse transcriptase (RNA-dependent DNA polymerase) [Fragilaria crotonensis]
MEMFRSFVGRILFACGKTEPTIANACRELTSHLTAPNEEHWNALSHLVGYLKTASLQGIKMRTPDDLRVVAYVDSDYAGDRNDRKSISGYLVTVGGCLVSWMSKKQTGVTLSSTEAEFVAMSNVATEVKFIVSLLTEIMGGGPDGSDGEGKVQSCRAFYARIIPGRSLWRRTLPSHPGRNTWTFEQDSSMTWFKRRNCPWNTFGVKTRATV